MSHQNQDIALKPTKRSGSVKERADSFEFRIVGNLLIICPVASDFVPF